MTSAIRSLVVCAALAAARGGALAQEHGADAPSPEEIKKKVLEIERLMRGAEESLARTTDTRTAAERAAQAARKMMEEKAREQTGKSCDQLREEAGKGSKEAAETLERLTREANEDARKAAEVMEQLGGAGGGSGGAARGVRELIEKVKGEGKGAAEGIRWLLEKAVQESGQGGGGGGGGQDKKEQQEQGKKDAKPEEQEKKDKPKDDPRKPQSPTEKPRTPEFEAWLAELPPQVRKAYETEDWDSIPPKWREMLREWTRKMAEELEKERR